LSSDEKARARLRWNLAAAASALWSDSALEARGPSMIWRRKSVWLGLLSLEGVAVAAAVCLGRRCLSSFLKMPWTI